MSEVDLALLLGQGTFSQLTHLFSPWKNIEGAEVQPSGGMPSTESRSWDFGFHEDTDVISEALGSSGRRDKKTRFLDCCS